MKIRSLGTEFHVNGGRTDRHDEANRRFFAIFANALKTLAEVFIPRRGYYFCPSVSTVCNQNNTDILNCDI